MSWIVLGEENGLVRLMSTKGIRGLLPKGSFLTVGDSEVSHILRVEDSTQIEKYHPSPLIAELDLAPLRQDQQCRNIVYARRLCDIGAEDLQLVPFILPQSMARLSTQEEIDKALGGSKEGPTVFLATVLGGYTQSLKDLDRKPLTVAIPNETFFHQILICGKTGSGKTVAAKYLSQYFVEKMEGAVLAVNVKDVDFLKMDKPSSPSPDYRAEAEREWKALGEEPHGVENFTIYTPPTVGFPPLAGVTESRVKTVTLSTATVDPEAIGGLLQGITDAGAQQLPGIFRYWKERVSSGDESKSSFTHFVKYFTTQGQEGRAFLVQNGRGEVTEVTLHKGTFDNIQRNLAAAIEFFDSPDAVTIDQSDILIPGKMSVINVAGDKGIRFGAVFLRDILRKVVDSKRMQESSTPLLIVIDEVHRFYDTGSSREALGDLDTICRTGRSSEIGVVFISQAPGDVPGGLTNVINTKLFFKSDSYSAKQLGAQLSAEELEMLRPGFSTANIHGIPLVKLVKFPLAYGGA